jgi:hypothetical protein
MKTKLLIAALFAVIFSSCSSPDFLPDVDEIDVNVYGSYITITRQEGETVRGELIAADSSKIIILTLQDDSATIHIPKIIPVKEISSFSLKYAEGSQYAWTIPLYTLASLSHGMGAVVSLPVNLITTIVVSSSGDNAFTYSTGDITYNKLRMFARFPQGIPPNIQIKSIK